MKVDFCCCLLVRRWMLWAPLLLFGLLAGSAAAAQPMFTVSTHSDVHGTIYLPVQIDGKIDARFFFDTGSLTFLSDAFVKKHGLATQAVTAPDGTPAHYPDGAPVSVVHVVLAVPGTPLQFTQDVPVLRAGVFQNMGVSCDGILGVDLLRGMAVHVNAVARRITFLPDGNLSAATLQQLGMDAAKSALLIPADGGRYQVPVSLGDVSGVLMLVDTGSEFTKVPPALARKLGSDWKGGGVIDTASGRFPVYSTRLGKVSLGGVTSAGQRVLYSDQPAGPTASPLGRDFFARVAVTFDFPAGKLYVRDLELGPGPTPFARRLRGEETLLPAYSISFPYGGKSRQGGTLRRYGPGSSVTFPGREVAEAGTVVRNLPTVGESRKPVEIPIEIENGVILVQATIDRQPVRMALDTGSIVTLLTPAAMRRLKLKENPAEANDLALKGVTLNSVALSREMPEFIASVCEGHVGDAQTLYCLCAGPVPKADGVLGLDCLANLVIGFDLAKSRLMLWPMASTQEERLRWVAADQPPSIGAISLPLEHEVGDWYYAEARLEDGQRTKLAIATGYAGGCRLPMSLAPARNAGRGGSIPGDRAGNAAEFRPRRAVAFNDFVLPSLTTEVASEKGVFCIPVLGLEAFRDRRVVLDFSAGKLLIGRRNAAGITE